MSIDKIQGILVKNINLNVCLLLYARCKMNVLYIFIMTNFVFLTKLIYTIIYRFMSSKWQEDYLNAAITAGVNVVFYQVV